MILIENLRVEVSEEASDERFIDDLEELCKKYAGKEYAFTFRAEEAK